MMKLPIKCITTDLLASPPAPIPAGFSKAAAVVNHANHLAAYQWALAYVSGRDVLEIGVNRGYGSRILATTARRFTGLDFDYGFLAEAKQQTGLPLVQADAQKLPFGDKCFEVVIAFQVIEHVWDVQAFLREIKRVLIDGGICILATPNADRRLLYGQRPWNDEHLREYDSPSLLQCARFFFGVVNIFGAFVEVPVDNIERRRVWQDPWAHYFSGPWGRPLRITGRLLGRFRRSRQKLTEDATREIAVKKPDELVKHFYFDIEHLEGALDLMVVCQKDRVKDEHIPFDTRRYWQARLAANPTLQGTGTSMAPESWQRWLYRGRKRAYKRLLRRNGIGLHGRSVLDFGCGTGYFEDVWEQWGAKRADGIDFVPEVIEGLSRVHPERRYLCADIADNPSKLALFEPEAASLLTAIDVLYHIVDDDRLLATLQPLSALVVKNGYFLFTDALNEQEAGIHVRFRSLNQWRQILAKLGMEVVDREPVFALNNRLIRGVGSFPAVTGAMQHFLDLPILRTMPWLANNWAVLARWKKE